MLEQFKGKTYGLVLEGGGAKGAYEMGVWKAIKELDIKISAVVGTSIGALNGALFAQGDYDKALEVWENIKYSSIINIEDDLVDKLTGARWREVPLHESGQQFLDIIKNRGLDITPLKNMINEMVDEEKLRNSNMDFGLVTFNVTDFKSMELMISDIGQGQVAGYLLASSYLPSFKSEKIFGKRFLDGAFHSVVPTSMLVDQGYKDIIEVRVQGLGIEKHVDKASDVNIIKITTSEDLGGVLEIKQDRIDHNIKLGYYDALRIFKGYHGLTYYLQAWDKEASYLKEFLKLPDKAVHHLCIAFGGKNLIKNFASKDRLVCEGLIPLIAKSLRFNTQDRYEDIYFGVLEYAADYFGLERFKVYRLKTFKSKIIGAISRLSETEEKELLRNDNLIELAYFLGL